MITVNEFYNSMPKGRCNPCVHAGLAYGEGSVFLGCYHKPYDGKWVRDIKDCPRNNSLDRRAKIAGEEISNEGD